MTARLALATLALLSSSSASEDSIRAVLDRMVQARETYLSVPVEDGRALRLLAEATAATRIVEIGTSTGYSGLWFCLAIQKTRGHLTTFEFDAARAARAREHFRQAGVADLVTIVEGDAHQRLATLRGPILAHNPESAPGYLRAVQTRPDLETILYREGAGLCVTLRRR